jgi:hypothetical protein
MEVTHFRVHVDIKFLLPTNEELVLEIIPLIFEIPCKYCLVWAVAYGVRD